MKSFFENQWVQGFVVEFIAAIVIAAVAFFFGHFIGKRKERRKKVKQFYKGIIPTLKTVSDVCLNPRLVKGHDGNLRMDKEDIKKIVKAISKSFSESFLDDSSWLVLEKSIKHDPGTPKDCSICEDIVPISQDACPNCSLDCCSWDWAKIRSQKAMSLPGTTRDA